MQQQAMINYTRSMEYEADRVGSIRLLMRIQSQWNGGILWKTNAWNSIDEGIKCLNIIELILFQSIVFQKRKKIAPKYSE